MTPLFPHEISRLGAERAVDGARGASYTLECRLDCCCTSAPMKQNMTTNRIGSPMVFGAHRHSTKGFTLVELFIVGALIALFAGLALFNVREQFDSNRRKAMIGEARNLGTSMGFAKMDTAVFPKFCFLTMSEREMQFEAVSRGHNADFYYNVIDYTNIATGPFAAGIKQNWRGPYFAASQSRQNISQGRGGFVTMNVPIEFGGTVQSEPFRWPADSWGNPWVLYLVALQRTSPTAFEPVFINGAPNFSPTLDPDYFTAIVSYGPNKVPGGGPGLDTNAAGATLDLRLYTGDYRNATFDGLRFVDYTGAAGSARARAVSNRFGTAALAPNDQGQPTGILDIGSDDVVYEF